MERVPSDAYASSAALARGSESNLALANRSWNAFNVTSRPAAQAPGAPEGDGPWRDADRALAEIRARAGGKPVSTPRDRAMLERATAAVRDSLLEAAQAATEASRRARALADLIDSSLATLANEQGERPIPLTPVARRADQQAESLSEREREVLVHVAEGRSNKAIAEELYVSPNTVKSHVSSLLRKLNASSRTQLATIAVQQGFC